MSEKGKLEKKFEQKMREWQKNKPEEYHHLLTKHMLWGAACLHPTESLWDGIKDQIEFAAKRRGITPEEMIDILFRCETAEDWMVFFQI